MKRKINIRNNKINPVLYGFYLRLKERLGAEIVHRRRRKSTNYIEVVFHSEAIVSLQGRLNTLREAESCGFWIICRHQSRRDHGTWHGRTVLQLFLSPVHPKKRRTALVQQTEISESVSFEPVVLSALPSRVHRRKKTAIRIGIRIPCEWPQPPFFRHPPN